MIVHLEKETPSVMGRVNKANVLHLIKTYGPVSRASVARMLNMSRSSISSIVEQLIKEGRVREGASGQSTSAGGRRPVQLHYVSQAKFAVGIDIGGSKTIAMVTDLDGNVMARRKFLSHAEGVGALQHILDEVEAFLADSGIDRANIIGTGIGFPGVTDPATGTVIQAPGLQLSHFRATEFFQSLPSPVCVDNDVNMGVIGECWQGVARGHRNVILIAIGTGIGAGLILDGKIYRGATGYAGEIGHLHIDPFTTGRKLDLGDYGPLEQTASGKGMEDLAAANLTRFPDSTLSTGLLDSSQLFVAARAGDGLARYVLNQALSYLSFSIANIVTLLNPELVILGGGVSRAGDPLLDVVRQRVAQLSPVACDIVSAGLGEDAAAFGGAATILMQAGELRLSGLNDLDLIEPATTAGNVGERK